MYHIAHFVLQNPKKRFCEFWSNKNANKSAYAVRLLLSRWNSLKNIDDGREEKTGKKQGKNMKRIMEDCNTES